MTLTTVSLRRERSRNKEFQICESTTNIEATNYNTSTAQKKYVRHRCDRTDTPSRTDANLYP